jgi:hypothetical protein
LANVRRIFGINAELELARRAHPFSGRHRNVLANIPIVRVGKSAGFVNHSFHSASIVAAPVEMESLFTPVKLDRHGHFIWWSCVGA